MSVAIISRKVKTKTKTKKHYTFCFVGNLVVNMCRRLTMFLILYPKRLLLHSLVFPIGHRIFQLLTDPPMFCVSGSWRGRRWCGKSKPWLSWNTRALWGTSMPGWRHHRRSGKRRWMRSGWRTKGSLVRPTNKWASPPRWRFTVNMVSWKRKYGSVLPVSPCHFLTPC